jgi:hypothetical protein
MRRGAIRDEMTARIKDGTFTEALLSGKLRGDMNEGVVKDQGLTSDDLVEKVEETEALEFISKKAGAKKARSITR